MGPIRPFLVSRAYGRYSAIRLCARHVRSADTSRRENASSARVCGQRPSRVRTRYCKLPTLSDNHFAPDLRDRRPSSPRPRSGARFCACFSLPTSATGGGAFQERGMCPYLLSLKVGSLRYKIRPCFCKICCQDDMRRRVPGIV